MWKRKDAYRVRWRNLRERVNMKALSVDGGIIKVNLKDMSCEEKD
jgi:hypothetical protein